MGNKIFILLCSIVLLHSCNTTNYLPGFDFKLFINSPVKELAIAVEKEDVKKINEVLKDKSINVNYQEPKFGHTLLMLAVANNKIKSVEALLKNNANPNLTSRENEDNSIAIAAENYSDVCDTAILNLLTNYGGDVNFTQLINRVENNGMHSIVNRTTLMIAVRNDCYLIVKYLIDKGAKINVYTYYEGYGAITEAIIQNNLKIVKYLIIDKQATIPSYIFKRQANISYKGEPEKYLTITDLLNEQQYDKGTENYKLREEIISYLENLK
jgi:ankyrin repeat protein